VYKEDWAQILRPKENIVLGCNVKTQKSRLKYKIKFDFY